MEGLILNTLVETGVPVLDECTEDNVEAEADAVVVTGGWVDDTGVDTTNEAGTAIVGATGVDVIPGKTEAGNCEDIVDIWRDTLVTVFNPASSGVTGTPTATLLSGWLDADGTAVVAVAMVVVEDTDASFTNLSMEASGRTTTGC